MQGGIPVSFMFVTYGMDMSGNLSNGRDAIGAIWRTVDHVCGVKQRACCPYILEHVAYFESLIKSQSRYLLGTMSNGVVYSTMSLSTSVGR